MDGQEALFNEDVFSGTGVADVLLVILLECPPVGKNSTKDSITKQTRSLEMVDLQATSQTDLF